MDTSTKKGQEIRRGQLERAKYQTLSKSYEAHYAAGKLMKAYRLKALLVGMGDDADELPGDDGGEPINNFN